MAKCIKCKKEIKKEETIKVSNPNGKYRKYCIKCFMKK